MRVVFAGPSLSGVKGRCDREVTILPPAAVGDILCAVADGATVVGLIDGTFDANAAVWHKEILFALEQGVTVVGGASMGALRAAECQAFGMRPVGFIARQYASGAWDDDALVALTHGPAELDYMPITEPLVDVEPTVSCMVSSRVVTPEMGNRLLRVARMTNFRHRTVRLMAQAVSLDAPRLIDDYEASRVRLKQSDALEVVDAVSREPDTRRRYHRSWRMNPSPAWRYLSARTGIHVQGH